VSGGKQGKNKAVVAVARNWLSCSVESDMRRNQQTESSNPMKEKKQRPNLDGSDMLIEQCASVDKDPKSIGSH
jgi:hypothetical protein